MGAKIDRAVGLVLLILGLYLLFLRAFGSIAAACGGAFLCCALLRRFRPRSTEDERAFRGRDSESLGARLG